MLVSCLAYSSNLEMETAFSSETSVNFQHTTQCYMIYFCLVVFLEPGWSNKYKECLWAGWSRCASLSPGKG
jgi:hypothetical protein